MVRKCFCVKGGGLVVAGVRGFGVSWAGATPPFRVAKEWGTRFCGGGEDGAPSSVAGGGWATRVGGGLSLLGRGGRATGILGCIWRLGLGLRMR